METQPKQPSFAYTQLCLLLVLFKFMTAGASCNTLNFKIDENEKTDFMSRQHLLSRSKRSETGYGFDAEGGKKCVHQEQQFLNDVSADLEKGTRLEETHVFVNESNYNLALAWASENNQGKLIVLTTDKSDGVYTSNLWRTKDHGRNWDLWNDKVNNKAFINIKRNPHNPNKLYLESNEQYLYVSGDGGDTWRNIELDDTLTNLEFHTDKKYEDFIVVGISPDRLYVTYDNFQSKPKKIKEKVHAVKWGTEDSQSSKNVFVLNKETSIKSYLMGPVMMDLERYDRGTEKWTRILKKVVVFDVQGKFMYASVFKSDKPTLMEDERLMMISSDGGKKWNEAQLPTLTGDRFFSVLDMSDGLIFMHVDNPGDTGHGTLYTSASKGIVYSESLKNHLFPNYNTVHDFYKVASIRGVFIASQMSPDKSIHTVVTYNRGGEWQNISRPIGVKCENDDKEGCFLQIHNAYSIHRGIKARMPTSQENAVGIFLVHAQVASNLQTTDPDVYLSTDGGYNFKKVLTGPHAYEIADSGGLLLAVPISTPYPNTIKFSLDEGDCWHSYKFTDDEIKFTGLVTEPGSKSMTVSLWGYHKDSKKWTVNTIDFAKVITRQCVVDDYEPWTPHTSIVDKSGQTGCLLGKKEIFEKVKPESWCQNGYDFEKPRTVKTCVCTEEDYECDYGFHRLPDSTKCVRQPEIKAEEIDICKDGHWQELESLGYRLVPGDECDVKSGFHPESEFKTLDLLCGLGQDNSAIKHDEAPPPKRSGSGKMIIFAVAILVAIIVASVGAFFAYKLILLRRHKQVYRYSMLSQSAGDVEGDELDHALGIHDDGLYKEDSDEEVEQENRSPQRGGSRGGAAGNPFEKPRLRGYHDDSDDDMLG